MWNYGVKPREAGCVLGIKENLWIGKTLWLASSCLIKIFVIQLSRFEHCSSSSMWFIRMEHGELCYSTVVQ